jgi:hypothetical protein
MGKPAALISLILGPKIYIKGEYYMLKKKMSYYLVGGANCVGVMETRRSTHVAQYMVEAVTKSLRRR